VHGIAPSRLCLEITETQMMQRPEQVAAVLAELGAVGVQIAIDDFGTGFSSLAYVRDLPAHVLKIDRAFVRDLPDSPRDAAVVAAIVRLARELGMQTVAEGVETPGQLSMLRRLGCDLAQGYLLGRPMPVPEFDPDALPAALVD
jgi:EAL domain-containing protein (putative c-di-GMP-specific phosphodiesterase class I)